MSIRSLARSHQAENTGAWQVSGTWYHSLLQVGVWQRQRLPAQQHTLTQTRLLLQQANTTTYITQTAGWSPAPPVQPHPSNTAVAADRELLFHPGVTTFWLPPLDPLAFVEA